MPLKELKEAEVYALCPSAACPAVGLLVFPHTAAAAATDEYQPETWICPACGRPLRIVSQVPRPAA